MSVHSFSKALRAFLWNKEVLAFTIEPFEVDWNDGGCLIMADAIEMWLAGPHRAVEPSVVAGTLRCTVPVPAPQHALVTVGSLSTPHVWYLDADGVSSESVLKRRWRKEGVQRPFIISDPTRELACSTGALRNKAVSLRLASMLAQRFPHAWTTLRQ